MSRNPGSYYLYIAIASLLAVVLVWIIHDSNIHFPENNKNISTSRDTLLLSENFNKLHAELLNNPDDPDLNMQMGNMLFDVEKYDQAIIYYRKAMSGRPDFISAQIDLSICYYNLNIVDTALIEMKKALRFDPVHTKGLFNMGVMYYNTSQIDSAKHYWQQQLDLHPDSPEADVARGILNNLTI